MAGREHARAIAGDVVDAYNRKDETALAALYSDDVALWSSLGEVGVGKEHVLAHIRDLFRRLPDERMTVDTMITDGETIVLELTSHGTSAYKPYELVFTEILEIRNGKVTSIETYIDPDDVEQAEA
jgi:ketosteroid isomerase-like protein